MQPYFVDIGGCANGSMEFVAGASLDAVLTFRDVVTDAITGDVTRTLVDLRNHSATLVIKDIDGNAIATLSTADGSIVLGGVLGTVTLNLIDTSDIPNGAYRYQLTITNTVTGKVTPLLGPAQLTVVSGL